MRLLVDPAFVEHATPLGHPERAERVGWILAELDRVGLLPELERPRVEAAAREALLAVHDARLVDRLESLAAAGGGPYDAETLVSPGSWRAATLGAGAAIAAARDAARGEPAFALVRPPGHHADRATAQGFCLLNNVAVAAEALLREGRARRVAIVDPDVHHGNGTQDVFYDRPDVLYVSTHNWPLYPMTGLATETGGGAGAGFTVNLPCPPLTGESAWKDLVETFALPILREFGPDVILVSAGFDAHVRDPLGRMGLTSDAYGWLAARLLEVTPRVAAVLEGGYDPVGLARGAASLVGGLAGAPVAYAESPDPAYAARPDVEGIRAALAPFWRIT